MARNLLDEYMNQPKRQGKQNLLDAYIQMSTPKLDTTSYTNMLNTLLKSSAVTSNDYQTPVVMASAANTARKAQQIAEKYGIGDSSYRQYLDSVAKGVQGRQEFMGQFTGRQDYNERYAYPLTVKGKTDAEIEAMMDIKPKTRNMLNKAAAFGKGNGSSTDDAYLTWLNDYFNNQTVTGLDRQIAANQGLLDANKAKQDEINNRVYDPQKWETSTNATVKQQMQEDLDWYNSQQRGPGALEMQYKEQLDDYGSQLMQARAAINQQAKESAFDAYGRVEDLEAQLANDDAIVAKYASYDNMGPGLARKAAQMLGGAMGDAERAALETELERAKAEAYKLENTSIRTGVLARGADANGVYDGSYTPQELEALGMEAKANYDAEVAKREQMEAAWDEKAKEYETWLANDAELAMTAGRDRFGAQNARDLEPLMEEQAQLDAQIAVLNAQKEQVLVQNLYNDVASAPDFKAKSVYDSNNGDYVYRFINERGTSQEDGQYNAYGYTFMLPDEVQAYNYIYATEGQDKAQEFLDSFVNIRNLRARSKESEEWAKYADEHGVWASVVSLGTNLASGLMYPLQAIDAKFNPNHSQFSPLYSSNYATQAIRGTVGQNVAEWAGHDLGNTVYQTLMSLGDFGVALAAGKGAGALAGSGFAKGMTQFIMSSEAGSSALLNNLQRGLSTDKAVGMSVASAMIEALTEKYSIEALLKEPKKAALYIAKNMLTEGSEEAASNLANTLVDLIVNADQAELAQAIAEKGYAQALTEYAQSVGMDAIMGAISGGVMSGGSVAVNKGVQAHQTAQTGKQINTNQTYKQLHDIAVAMPEGSKARKIAQGKEKLNNRKAGQLYNALMQELDAKSQAGVRHSMVSEINGRLQELGATGDTNQLAEAIQKVWMGEKLSARESDLIARNKVAMQVQRELLDLEAGWADKAQEAASKQRREALNQMLDVERLASKGYKPAQDDAAAKAIAKNASTTYANADQEQGLNTKAYTKEGTAVEIKRIEEQDGQAVYLVEKDGQDVTYAINDLELDSINTENLVQPLKQGKMSVKAANTMMQLYATSGLSAPLYVKGFTVAYNAGVQRIGMAYVNANSYSKALSPEARKAAFDAGMADTKDEAPRVTKRKGRVTVDKSIDKANLTDNQKASIRAMEKIAKALGIDIEFFASQADATGSYAAYENGSFRDGVMRLDINAGKNSAKDVAEFAILRTASHELTHYIAEASPQLYRDLQAFVVDHLLEKGQSLQTLMDRKKARENREMSDDAALEEVIADACEMMLKDSTAIETLARENATLFEKIADWLRDFFDKIREAFAGVEAVHAEARALMEADADGVMRYIDGLQALWDKALVDAAHNVSAVSDVGAVYDASTESAAPTMYSLRTWNESEYMANKKKAAEELSVALGVSKSKAMRWIDDINGIAKMVAENKELLDYEANEFTSAIKSNAEYGGSVDFSTICAKRRLATGTLDAIQRALRNSVLTQDDIFRIRNMMLDKGYEVACGLCYVESARKDFGRYAKAFLDEYKQTNPAWIPDMADVNTVDGLDDMRREHPEAYAAYEKYMNKLAQRKPKLYEKRTEYRNEILKKFKGDDTVSKKNLAGGFRIQSFSDFEIVHLLDMMQVIMDMSHVGLAGQAYTKVPDFAWALGDTGLKINLSMIAKGVKDGKIVFDEREGMKVAEAKALRDRYSQNVGTILVVFSDAQLKAALNDDFIDFIIPFHRSQWSKKNYGALGLPTDTRDFTSQQNERYIKPHYNERGKRIRPVNYSPNAYWDYNKTGKENAETYLRMCAEDGRRPKFAKLLVDNGDGSYSLQPDGSTDGYWKLLIDFKMYDNAGNGSPQLPVQPNFNMEQAQRMLTEYKGGHAAYPVAQDIVDEFVREHRGERLSVRDADTISSREILANTRLEDYKQSAAYGFLVDYQKAYQELERLADKLDKYQKAAGAGNLDRDEQIKADNRVKLVRDQVLRQENKLHDMEKKPVFNQVLANERKNLYDSVDEMTTEQLTKQIESLEANYKAIATASAEQLEEMELALEMNLGKRAAKEKRLAQERADRKAEAAREKADAKHNKLKGENDALKREMSLTKRKVDFAVAEKELALEMNLGRKREQMRQRYEKRIDMLKRKYERLEGVLERTRAMYKRHRDSETRSALRDRIKHDVKALNRLLLNETDTKHVPEELKGAVAQFLTVFTQDSSVFEKGKLDDLRVAYGKISDRNAANDDLPDISAQYDLDIATMMDDLRDILPGKRLSELTQEETRKIRDIVQHFKFIVKESSRLFFFDKSRNIANAGQKFIEDTDQQKKYNGPDGAVANMLRGGMITPSYFFKKLGGVAKELFDDLKRGESTYGLRVAQARKFFDDVANKYHYDDWRNVKDDVLTLQTQQGHEVVLTREQALGLYATWNRENSDNGQNAKHLSEGGFVYENAMKKDKKTGKIEVDTSKPHKMTDADMQKVASWLTDEQRAYADAMVDYMSKDMAKLGNEVSMKLFGIEKYGEEKYYPYQTSKNYRYTALGAGDMTNDQRLKHSSFTHRVTQFANNPVIAADFTTVWANHVNHMLLYSSMCVPLENFNRVYNYKYTDEDGNHSVKQSLVNAYGSAAQKYIEQLMRDLNGGVAVQSDGVMDQLISRFKKNAVYASMSVVVQQPSAMVRAMALVNPKYFASGVMKDGNWDELTKYSGVAVIKEMGGFDTSTGFGAQDFITGERRNTKAETFLKKADDAASFLPERADRLGWVAIWRAVKAEVADNTDLTGEKLLQAAAQRFNEVIGYTQVYDSTLSKSQMMRNKHLNAVTAFMSEPTVTYNLLVDAFTNQGKADSVNPARAVAAFTATAIVNALLKSLVTAARDDEEKNYLEKYAEEFVENVTSDLNPLNLIPYARDIVSIVQGYDVERADMSLVSDLYKGVKKAIESGKEGDWYTMAKEFAGPISGLVGLPVKNVWRDIEAVFNTIHSIGTPMTPGGMKYSLLEALPFYGSTPTDYYNRRLDAMLAGDDKELESLTIHLETGMGKDTKTIKTQTKTQLGNRYKAGKVSDAIATDILMDYFEMDADEAYWQLKEWREKEAHKDEEDYSFSRTDDLKEALLSGKTAQIEAAKTELAGVGGYTDKEVTSKAKSAIKSLYVDGQITFDKAVEMLNEQTDEYLNEEKGSKKRERQKKIENDLFWLEREWEYAKANKGNDDADTWNKYTDMHSAIESGKGQRAAVKYLMDHGVTKSGIASSINSRWAEEYKKLYETDRKAAIQLQSQIIDALVAAGYNRAEQVAYIRNNWLK